MAAISIRFTVRASAKSQRLNRLLALQMRISWSLLQGNKIEFTRAEEPRKKIQSSWPSLKQRISPMGQHPELHRGGISATKSSIILHFSAPKRFKDGTKEIFFKSQDTIFSRVDL